MSNEENAKQAIESTQKFVGNTLSLLKDLKEKNPKVFFGGIGGIAVLLLIMLASGGDNKPPLQGPAIKNLVIGQQYVLKSANSYDSASTVRLVSVPGALAAYDDSEEADRNGACQHMAQGTKVTALEFQDFAGKKNAFVKVKMLDGECKDNEGWALAIDIQ
ncbi:MAG: hypothetical protein HOP23_09115 [Methylococcaceae bacterium]|nr:hypothetical protein [Methylococcaceae bacterium]